MEKTASLSCGIFSIHSPGGNGTLLKVSWPLALREVQSLSVVKSGRNPSADGSERWTGGLWKLKTPDCG